LRKQKPSSNSRPQDGTDEKYESLAGTKQKKHFEFTNDGNLNPTQFEEVTKMLEQQIKLFDVKDRNPVVSNVRHEIDTENSKPVHCQPKQIGFKERDYIKQQVTVKDVYPMPRMDEKIKEKDRQRVIRVLCNATATFQRFMDAM
jgi:hypothetical protein